MEEKRKEIMRSYRSQGMDGYCVSFIYLADDKEIAMIHYGLLKKGLMNSFVLDVNRISL